MPCNRRGRRTARWQRARRRSHYARQTLTETADQLALRRHTNAAAMAIARTNQSQEQQALTRQANTVAMSAYRANQSQEQQSLTRQANTAAMSAYRANQSQEQQALTRQATTAAMSAYRANQSQEQQALARQANTAAMSAYRADQSQEQQALTRQANAAAMSAYRANQSHEQRYLARQANAAAMTVSRTMPWASKNNSAFAYNADIDYSSDPMVAIGSMSIACQHCHAMKWRNESPGMCCGNGKVKLPQILDPPEVLQTLLTSSSSDALHFQNNIRKYNSCFQMTSFGTTKEIRESGFMPTFKVQGQVYHRIGGLQPLANECPKFLQLYFIADADQEADQRYNIIPETRRSIIVQLQNLLHSTNNYVRSFKCAMESLSPNYNIVIHADRTPSGEHERRYNVPAASEVAVIIAGEPHGNRDIVLQLRDNSLRKVVETHRSYDALQYPLIFWEGEDGYHFELRQTNPSTGEPTQKKISAMDFYAYRMMMRCGTFNHLLRCKQLFQQFVVDMYAKIEAERLRFIRLNQTRLRVESYSHLRDAMSHDGDSANVGQLVILPSSFTGGPRYMHERTQDAMTYVRNYGCPHLFITFTCNPKWQEVTDELLANQKPHERHDLLARVFHLKLKSFMSVITKGKVFGSVLCHMYSVEWQKRGLPHAHILIWLRETFHVHRVDDIICAEIPDPDTDPVLFNIVTSQMIHGPCGNVNPRSPCMKDNKCSKNYPKQLVIATQTGRDGYPLYRRRSPDDGGFTATLKVCNFDTVVDNRWVVPYCPLLSRSFNAHINVEYCHSIQSIKYVCKYINKGTDMAVFGLGNANSHVDEVRAYEVGRYISSNEAVWRILNFPIHERYPTVVHLSVHLPNTQRVYFTEHSAQQRAENPPDTTLTAFFRLCQEDSFAQTLFYNELPKYYTWNSTSKKWARRRAGISIPEHPEVVCTEALGRVYTVHPNNFECFFLRLLLHNVKGPTSFQHLLTVDTTVCATYKQACMLRGLLEDDTHWNSALQEAATIKSSFLLRNLFAIMLQTCGMSDPYQLWINHRDNMSEDILHQIQIQNPDLNVTFNDAIYNQALIMLEDKLLSLGGSALATFGLPDPERIHDAQLTTEIIAETSYDTEQLNAYVVEKERLLIPCQRHAFEAITESVFGNHGSIFFLNAPGGTGKTFLINLILAKVRQRKLIALAVASSGIAATLLSGGRTAHSLFKLPLNLAAVETPTCNISRGTGKARLLEQCRLIVWDECTMSHKGAVEAVDRTLKDIRHNSETMGGTTLVLAGDFRQTLPVILRGTKADELNACIKSSYIWSKITCLNLTTNMRAHLSGDPAAAEFACKLLQIGNGDIPACDPLGSISVCNIGNIINTLTELIQAVFPNVSLHFHNHAWLCERAILAPRNDAVTATNLQLLHELPGPVHHYKSVDTVLDKNDVVNYPSEFLNSLEPSGVPSHDLQLKVGTPIMLLRNLDPPKLCNGTRMVVNKLLPNVIEATIITGHGAGECVFIPRIPIIPSDLPFQFKRVQFPVRLSFAMTINKAQGQSLKVVGVDLQSPCFSHGQLYVACSRVGNSNNLFILAPEGKTCNIVYREALTH